ncbi:sporulation protein [Novosphingobium guangzhouense]|uniref:Sporulation protein n=1 Tax=Novosphingobium guangzhouense TaxID=1850347 RepID=A0A2K2FW89_9SPHN|nr:sporulation protein [Novosphingobium guangzhouense]
MTAAVIAFALPAWAGVQAAPAAGTSVKDGVDAWSAGNYDGAVRIWQPLADRGDPDAQFNLAQAYKLGRGEPLDLSRAEALYGMAAAKGHVQAADAYGLLLFQRGERQRALPYIRNSAARGDPRAQYILGVAHFNGDLVPKDWVRAYALASLARQAGLPQATSALEQMDRSIPLEDRQKSVVLAQQLAAETQANRQQLTASSELGTHAPIAVASNAPPPARPAAAKPEPQTSPAPAPAPVSKPQPAPAAKPATAPRPVTSGPWRVQLGAFGVAGNAEALWGKIKGRPELAGHPRALVPAGKLTKLQATGFASKADADAACARLTAGGFGCLPSRD